MTIHGSSILMLFLRNGLVKSVTATEATCPIIYQGLHNSGSSAVNVGIRPAPRSLRHFADGKCVGFPFVNQAAPMARVNLVPQQSYAPSQIISVHFILRYQRTNTLNNFRLELDLLFLCYFFVCILHEIYTHSFRVLYLDVITSSWALSIHGGFMYRSLLCRVISRVMPSI